jgi:ubiquinone/menaquinone biosynthesis C-methylase UbiE
MTEHNASRSEQEYLLGTNDEELLRLGFQNEVWSEYASRAWERAGFGPDQTLLDLGCGPGYATFELARLVGTRGKVIAVDASERFVRYLESQKDLRGATNIFTQLGNVQELQLPSGSIDGAYIRWVLCYLSKPESVIDAVAGALRPGGSLVIHDYFNYRGVVVAPHAEIFERIFHAVDRSFRAAGGDPDILSRVPAMILNSGLQIQELNPMIRIARPGSALWKWPETFLQNFLPHLRESGFITTAEMTEFQSEWEKRSRDPAAFFATPPMLELIAIKK